jgi:hypothetical protein
MSSILTGRRVAVTTISSIESGFANTSCGIAFARITNTTKTVSSFTDNFTPQRWVRGRFASLDERVLVVRNAYITYYEYRVDR